MSKHNKNNEQHYNKTERYLREENGSQNKVGGQQHNQLANKGQADIQRTQQQQQGSQKNEFNQGQKNEKKSDFRKK